MRMRKNKIGIHKLCGFLNFCQWRNRTENKKTFGPVWLNFKLVICLSIYKPLFERSLSPCSFSPPPSLPHSFLPRLLYLLWSCDRWSNVWVRISKQMWKKEALIKITSTLIVRRGVSERARFLRLLLKFVSVKLFSILFLKLFSLIAVYFLNLCLNYCGRNSKIFRCVLRSNVSFILNAIITSV